MKGAQRSRRRRSSSASASKQLSHVHPSRAESRLRTCSASHASLTFSGSGADVVVTVAVSVPRFFGESSASPCRSLQRRIAASALAVISPRVGGFPRPTGKSAMPPPPVRASPDSHAARSGALSRSGFLSALRSASYLLNGWPVELRTFRLASSAPDAHGVREGLGGFVGPLAIATGFFVVCDFAAA